MPDLLYEIGTEELPASYIQPALEQLASEVERRLKECRLGCTAVRTAGTPRRLTVWAGGVAERQPPETVRTVGPPVRAAFDAAGRPTDAAVGFARSKGVPVESLQIEQTPRGPYVVAVVERPGLLAEDILPEVLAQVTSAISFPKSMRWEPSGFLFARPIRWLVAMLGQQVLNLQIAGVRAQRRTRGHKFMAPEEVELPDASFEGYLEALRKRFVIADIAERQDAVRRQVAALLEKYGSQPGEPELLREVTHMVEWPHAVEGTFAEEYLSVPAPILCAAMMEHQRYFPVRDGQGRLIARFIAVSDRSGEQNLTVREGNERVLRARLEDARFFYRSDLAHRLEDRVERLKGVVFLGGLGDNYQRTQRLVELSTRIADRLGHAEGREHVRRAAFLCKADLVSGLVGEFPSLQGIVGCELARAQGEPEPVAVAIAEHYRPAGADDALPATLEGAVLALADKLDTMMGCFSLGLLPSGSQDPYALRRNAMGILLIVEKMGLDLRLGEMVEMTRQVARQHGVECGDEAVQRALEFFRDRLYNAALERGFRHDFVRAALAAGYDNIKDFWCRLEALQQCAQRDWWPNLVELVDRTFRIHRDVAELPPLREDLLTEPLEIELARTLRSNAGGIEQLFQQRRYVEGAERYCAAFARLVHEFFDKVFVNVPDEAVRLNRKSLCASIYRLFARSFADLYLIQDAVGKG